MEGEAAVLWTLSVYLADRVYTRLPACAWRLLDSERFEGVPVSSFFRPTPLGFRQVVQHVRLHVAEMSELVN